jgi:hypothetical protein
MYVEKEFINKIFFLEGNRKYIRLQLLCSNYKALNLLKQKLCKLFIDKIFYSKFKNATNTG